MTRNIERASELIKESLEKPITEPILCRCGRPVRNAPGHLSTEVEFICRTCARLKENSAPPEDRSQCEGITRRGTQCRRQARPGSRYCELPSHQAQGASAGPGDLGAPRPGENRQRGERV